MPRPPRERNYQAAIAGALLSLLTLAAPLRAQVPCPPPAEGTVCGHYHYHVLLWHVRDRTFQEVAGTRQFVSLDACEKARLEAAKENQLLAGFMKTSVESSFQPDQFRDCHCDRTADKTTSAYLDPSARLAQSRTRHDAAWAIRERLLGSDAPRAGEFLRSLFGQEPRADRLLRKPFPSRIPEAAPPAASSALLETRIGGNASAPPIAASLSFIEIPLPSAGMPLASHAPSGAHSFFAYELARADAILAASEKIADSGLRSDVHQEVNRRKRVLGKLQAITSASPPESAAARALQNAADEAARIALVRGLFGEVVARAWAPGDARGAAATASIPESGGATTILDATVDVDTRRASLYAALGQEGDLSETETQTFVRVIEELIGK